MCGRGCDRQGEPSVWPTNDKWVTFQASLRAVGKGFWRGVGYGRAASFCLLCPLLIGLELAAPASAQSSDRASVCR
eukprot:5472601-Pleurochrysis_carterae.AAC.4